MLTLGLLATGASYAHSQQNSEASREGPVSNSVQTPIERIPGFTTRFSNGFDETTGELNVVKPAREFVWLAQEQRERKSRTPYIVGGALLGGLVTAVAIAVYVGNSPDAIMVPVALLPAVLGGAIIGGVIGAVISR